MLRLYKIWQTRNRGYETYDSAVVIAESKEDARLMHPLDGHDIRRDRGRKNWDWVTNLRYVRVKLIGYASKGSKRSIVVASFHSG